jgi:hypothetical protein
VKTIIKAPLLGGVLALCLPFAASAGLEPMDDSDLRAVSGQGVYTLQIGDGFLSTSMDIPGLAERDLVLGPVNVSALALTMEQNFPGAVGNLQSRLTNTANGLLAGPLGGLLPLPVSVSWQPSTP